MAPSIGTSAAAIAAGAAFVIAIGSFSLLPLLLATMLSSECTCFSVMLVLPMFTDFVLRVLS
jgi:hypothetical protein